MRRALSNVVVVVQLVAGRRIPDASFGRSVGPCFLRGLPFWRGRARVCVCHERGVGVVSSRLLVGGWLRFDSARRDRGLVCVRVVRRET
uniref:Secreted protein n=1 Tax=Anopheles albimanus TaxID=7167 RepID=A0A182FY86_ANOAL